MNRLERAKRLLWEENLTCVLVGEDREYKTDVRGVRYLLRLIENGEDVRGFSVADKVVGKGAAFLYVLLGVKEVYADVVSEGARTVLFTFGISVSERERVERILNRKGDGPCPIEHAVRDCISPEEAYVCIVERLKELAKE